MATGTIARPSRNTWSANFSGLSRLLWKTPNLSTEPSPDRNTLPRLPTELLFQILGYLEFWEIWFRVALVNKRLRDVANAELLSRSGDSQDMNREDLQKLAYHNQLPVHNTQGKQIPIRKAKASPVVPLSLSEVRTYLVNPTLRLLTCHITSSGGLTCYYDNIQLPSIEPGNATVGPSILLEPILYPAVEKARVSVHPISHFTQPIVMGGWYTNGAELDMESSRGVFSIVEQSNIYPVTLVDIVVWLADYLQKHSSVFREYKCFGIHIKGPNVFRYQDGVVDLYIEVRYVAAEKFLQRVQQA